eukprot:493678-Amphidinium_carterae.1
MEIIRSTYALYNLEVNLNAGKTELVMNFMAQSSELKAGLVTDSSSRGLDRPSLALKGGYALL